jgi:transmembrane protein TMEM260 (protein O-mannosyltransferase)
MKDSGGRLANHDALAPTSIAGIVFLATAALYVRSAAPTLGGAFDSEEFQYVAYTLGVAHATGYPLYLLLGKLFVTLDPLGNIAYRMNLLSAIIGAGAATLVYVIAFNLTRRHIASVATAALFATNAAVWRQSGVASVGPLTMFFIGAVVLSILLWRQHRVPLGVVAFICGLGLTHHHSILLFLPVIVLFVLFTEPNILHRPGELMGALVWLLLPLLIYLYIPLRGNVSAWYHSTLDIFFTPTDNGASDFFRTTQAGIAQAASTLLTFLWSSLTPVGWLFVLLGAVSLFPKARGRQSEVIDPRIDLFLGLGACYFIIVGSLFGGGEPDRYESLPLFFLITWFAVGAGFFQSMVERKLSGHPLLVAQGLALVLIVLPTLYTLRDNYRYADWSSFDRVYKQWNEIFTLPIPQNATIVGNWGQLNAMRYMQTVEDRRRDLLPIGTLYDPAPQTQAARQALDEQRAIFLAPGITPPTGQYRFGLLGPLLQVHHQAQKRAPDSVLVQMKFASNPSLTLVGFGVSTALEPYAQTQNISPTRTARIALHWHAEGSPGSFLVRLRLYDPETRLITQLDEPPVRGLYPADQWDSGEYVDDVHNLLIPGGTPPGKYKLTLAILDESKALKDAETELATLNIDRVTNLTRDQVFIVHPLSITLDDRIAIAGYGGFEGSHRAGENIAFSLLWVAHENVSTDTAVHFALEDTTGIRVLEWSSMPISYYPTRLWQKGELLKAYYDVKLPGELPPGELGLSIGTNSGTMNTIGTIQVTK